MYIGALLLVFSFLIPNHYLPWMSFYSEFLAFLSLFVICIFLNKDGFEISWFGVFCFVVAFIPVLQWVVGIVYLAGDAVVASFYLFCCCFALVSGRQAFGFYGDNVYKGLAFSFIFASIASVGFAICQWLGLALNSLWILDIPVGSRAIGNVAQANHLATLLSLGLISALYLVDLKLIGRFSSFILCVFLIFGLVLTQSRTPWAAGFCFLVWWLVKTRGRQGLMPSIKILGWIVFYAFCILCLSDVSELLLLNDGVEGELAQRIQSAQRIPLWMQMIVSITNSTAWGYGWNQVGVAQVMTSLEYPVRMLSLHSHNIVLDIFVWNGIFVGSLIIILVVSYLLRRAVAACSLGSVVGLGFVGVMLVHGLLEYPLEYSYFLLPLFFIMGCIEKEQNVRAVLKIYRLVFVSIVGLMLVGLVYTFYEYRIIEEDMRLLRFEMAGVGGVSSDHKAPDVIILTQLQAMIQLARSDMSENMGEDQMKSVGQVAFRYPYVVNLYKYTLALALNNRLDESVDILLRMRAIYGSIFWEQIKEVISDEARSNKLLVPLRDRVDSI